MKRLLNFIILFTLILCSTTSCRDDSYDYDVEKFPLYSTVKKGAPAAGWKLYTQPSTKSTVKNRVHGGYGLGQVKESKTGSDGKMWYHIAGEYTELYSYKSTEYDLGWIPAEHTYCNGEYETLKTEIKSRARIMEKADQPIAHFILKTKEQIREKHPLDDHMFGISVIYSVLIWLLFLIIRISKRVRIWHIIATIVVVLLQYLILATCDIYHMQGRFDDPFLNFIFGVMWFTAPVAQLWVISALLTPILFGEDVLCSADDTADEVEEAIFAIPYGHLCGTILSILVLLGCYHFNKDWVDGAIIFCAVMQLIVFLSVLAITEGSFKRTAIYMPLAVLMIIPTAYISLTSFVYLLGIIVVFSILFGTFSVPSIANVASHKIVNAYGQEIDTVDSSGHSDKTGHGYDISSDGTAERKY